MKTMMRNVKRPNFVCVDLWDTVENPISEEDRIVRNVKGEIVLPISQLIYGDGVNNQLDFFAMSTKRSYNSEEARTHICRYLNYFEKFYDVNRELLMVMYEIKVAMDYNKDYSQQMFMSDVNKYIIRNDNLYRNIKRFVNDNYMMNLSGNGNTPNLQFEDSHAKVLYEISLMMNMYIPLATHFMYLHFIKQREDVEYFMLTLFSLAVVKYEEEEGIYIYDKLYEIATSIVNKSKAPHRILWDKNMIRGNNAVIHTKNSVTEIILLIMPKYSYYDTKKGEVRNIINFNYYSNRQCLRYNIISAPYELQFIKLSSSKRDQDNNSEFDRFEARINKKDEALSLQNKCQAEQTVKRVELLYGPFSDDEILHYQRKLTKDNNPVINSFQKQLVGYLFFKEFGDPITLNSINQLDYIKLVIAAKRILKNSGMVILPYIISSKVIRVATRKGVNKKELTKIQSSEQYEQIKRKYNNPKLEQKMLDMVGKIISSSFEIIDYDDTNKCPTEIDGQPVPIVNDIVDQELQFFIIMI